jgi:hypothetical protein
MMENHYTTHTVHFANSYINEQDDNEDEWIEKIKSPLSEKRL